MEVPFSFEEVFSQAKQKMSGKWGLLVSVTFLMPVLLSIVQSTVKVAVIGGNGSVPIKTFADLTTPAFRESFALGLAFWLVSSLMYLGMFTILLKVVRGVPVTFGELFSRSDVFLNYLAGAILFALAVAGGFILFILPGIFFIVRFSFYHFFIVDRGVGGKEALRLSWRATEGNFWNILGLMIVVVCVNIGGMLALGFGILYTAPLTGLMMACVYEQLATRVVSTTATPSIVA